MPVPRRKQFDPSNPPWVHCISRCVRRAFLAGQDHGGFDGSNCFRRGVIPPELAPILQRFDRDLENWLTGMFGFRQFLGAAVGRLASRALEAGRRGLRWMQNRCGLFAGEQLAERG